MTHLSQPDEQLRGRDAVWTDLRDDLVGPKHVVVVEAAQEYPRHHHEQRTNGDIESVLLVLFALPL